MELILQILMLFIGINCLIKLSFWKVWQTALFGLLCALFMLFSESYAITLSKTKLEAFLNDTVVLQDMAVWITAESAICFGFCLVALRNLYGTVKKRKWLALYWYPGLLLFPVLFYLLTQLIFSMPGIAFDKIARILAAAVFLLIPAGSWLLKKLFPEPELKLEIHFLLSFFICIIGLLCTVNGNTTYMPVSQQTNYEELGMTFVLFLVFTGGGLIFARLKWSFRNTLSQNKFNQNKHIQKSK